MKPCLRLLFGLSPLAAVFLGTQFAAAQTLDRAQYFKEIEQWKAYRIKRVTSKTGYLALTGLFWIPGDGAYSFGGAASCDLVFPGRDVPPKLGVLTFSGDAVSLEVAPGVEIANGDHSVESGPIFHDHDETHPATELQWGTLTWWVIKRGHRYAVRLRDSDSPTLRAFKGLDRYATDPAWRIEGRFDKYDPPKGVDIVDIDGNVSHESCPGAVVFQHDGKEYRLEGTSEFDGKDYLYFIVFGDKTNGKETYGGGRFLYVDVPGKDGKVIIDFNKAYSPWCAFSSYTTCPLPPEQNRLPFEVTAGEKDYKRDDEDSDQ